MVIAVLMALAALFFYDPFSGIGLTEWDRSFCAASLAGIDPSKRVSSFYKLYFLFPCLAGAFAWAVSALLKGRPVPHFGLSVAVSFLLVLVSYTLRFAPAPIHSVAAVLAAACFLWQWALVFWARRGYAPRGALPRSSSNGLIGRVWQWTKSRPAKLAFVYVSMGVLLLCGLPALSLWDHSAILANLNVGLVVAAGIYFVFFASRGGLKNVAEGKLDKLGVVGLFVLVSSFVSTYSRFAIPVLAAHSVFFAEHVEANGALLFSSSVAVLMSLSYLYVLAVARNGSCEPYRDFVAAMLLPVSLSLLLPLPLLMNAILAFALLLFLQKKHRDMAKAHATLAWFPLVFCLLCELFFTLFEKGLVAFSPVYGVYAVSLLFLAASLLKGRWRSSASAVSENVFYVGALLSFTALAYGGIAYFHEFQNVQTDFKDFYEYGNLLGIVETLESGKVPVIDYFSAHALSDVFTGILHGIVHGSTTGALIDPYRDFVIFSCGGVLLFFILSKFFSPFFSFALICLFPLNTNAFHFVDICLAGVLLHLGLYGKPGVWRLPLFWFLVALLAFYRYDTGVAFGVASIFASVLLFASRRDKSGLLKFALSGLSVSALLLVFYFVYCGMNGIAAVDRMREWIALTLHSNGYWAEEVLANSLTSPLFILAYLLIPLAESFVVFYVVVESLLNRKLEKTAGLALVFAVAGLFLLTRAFVFYTLSFTLGRGCVMFCYSVFALSFFLFHLLRQKRVGRGLAAVLWLLAVSFGIWVCNGANHFLPDATNLLANRAVSNMKEIRESLLWHFDDLEATARQERFRMDDTLSYYSAEFKSFFSRILEEHETFLDFADIPAVYALAGREKPFYSAQSPGLLSDLYSQEMFLREIESKQVPVAITAWKDAGHMQVIALVPHQVRFYKVAEYLYTRYRPLAHVGDFVVWCKPEKYWTYLKKLVGGPWKLAEYGYEPNSAYHHFDLKWNPYVWANADRYRAAENPVLDRARLERVQGQGAKDGSRYRFGLAGSKSYPSPAGKYVALEIRSAGPDRANVTFAEEGDTASRYGYDFDLKEGTHRYLVRASQDYNWHAFNINSVELGCNRCEVDGVQILQGD